MRLGYASNHEHTNIWAPSSEFVSSSIPSWQILTAHAQPFRRARDLAFCLKVPVDSLLVWVSSGGSGETARMRRLASTFAARIGDKYQIRLTRSIWYMSQTMRKRHLPPRQTVKAQASLRICAVSLEHSLIAYIIQGTWESFRATSPSWLSGWAHTFEQS